MKRGTRWILAAVAFAALIVGAYRILNPFTATTRARSVEKLEKTIAVILPEETAPPTAIDDRPNRAPGAGYAGDEHAVRASWQELFRFWRDVRLSDSALDAQWQEVYYLPLFVRWGGREYDALKEDELALLAAFFEKNGDIVERIRALTQPGMPKCVFGSYKDISAYEQFDKLLSAHMLLEASRGAYESAVRDVIALLRMCDADPYLDYPFSMHSGTLLCVDDALRSGTLSEQLRRTLFEQLTESRDHDTFAKLWAQNAAHRLEWYADLPHSTNTSVKQSPRRHSLMWAYRYAGTPLLNHNVALFGEVMDQLLELAPLPYYIARPEIERIRDEYGIPPPWELPPWKREPGWNVISTLVHERFDGQASTEANIDMTRMAILLEDHRARHGAYPETIAAIADGFAGELPINPLDGKPYRYERQEDGFRLWYSYANVDSESGEEVHRVHIWPAQYEPVTQ